MSIAREVMLAPLYCLYGLYLLATIVVRLIAGLFKLRSYCESTIKCPTCGTPNDVFGRWVCGDCGAEYLGSVRLCNLCGSSVSWFACSRCRASIGVTRR